MGREVRAAAGDRCNVLISSGGRRVVLARLFREALADLGLPGEVHVADMSPLSAAMVDAASSHLVPPCTDAEYLPSMLELCGAHEIRLLVPTIDTELPVLSGARDAFLDGGTTVAVSSPGVVRIARDKRLTHEWLVGAGLPTVTQWAASDPPSDAARFPLLAKPRFGSASHGIEVLAAPLDVERLGTPDEYVLEELAPGHEVTTDLYVDAAGALQGVVPRRRLAVRGGEVSKGVVVHVPELDALASRVVASLSGPKGVLNFQSFVDPASGRIAIIELNARFGGGFPLSHRAGAPFPRWMLEELCGLPRSARDPLQYGLVMLRYDDAVFTTSEALGSGR